MRAIAVLVLPFFLGAFLLQQYTHRHSDYRLFCFPLLLNSICYHTSGRRYVFNSITREVMVCSAVTSRPFCPCNRASNLIDPKHTSAHHHVLSTRSTTNSEAARRCPRPCRASSLLIVIKGDISHPNRALH